MFINKLVIFFYLFMVALWFALSPYSKRVPAGPVGISLCSSMFVPVVSCIKHMLE